jgi:hypothetical protein
MDPEAAGDISFVFDAKEDLQRARSTVLEPSAVKRVAIRLAE